MIEYKNSENAMQQFLVMATIMTMPAYLLTALSKPTLKKILLFWQKHLFKRIVEFDRRCI